MLNIVVIAVLYGCGAFLCLQFAESLCAKIQPFEDGPRPGKPPLAALLIGSVLVGAFMAARVPSLPIVAMSGIVTAALAACWYCDVRCGILPDCFTLGPIALIAVVAAINHNWYALVSMVVVFIPFALSAYVSKGIGMGWGDAKLAALGGGLLGMNHALLAFIVASLLAVAVAWLRGRGRKEPIAFAPYLAGCIAVATSFGSVGG